MKRMLYFLCFIVSIVFFHHASYAQKANTIKITDQLQYSALFKDGVILYSGQEYSLSLERFLLCCTYSPADPQLNLFLGNTYFRLKEYSKAQDHYARVQNLSADDHQKVQFNRAICYLQMGQRDTTYQLLNQLIMVQPQYELLNLLLADLYFEDQDYLNALGNYERYLAINPKDKEAGYAYYHIAYILFKRGEYEKAAQEMMHAIPYMISIQNESEIYFNYAFTLEKLNNNGDALFYYTKAAERLMENDRAYKALAEYFYSKQDFQRVIEFTEQAIHQKIKGDALYYFILAVCYSNLKQPERSVTYLNMISDLQTDIAPETLGYYRAMNFFLLQKYEQAEKAILVVLDQKPGDYDMLAFLATILHELKKDQRALEIATQQLEKSGNKEIHKILAYVYAMMNDWKHALESLNVMEPLYPNNEAIQLNKGLVLMRVEDYNQAATYFQRLLKTNDRLWQPHFYLGWIQHSQADYAGAKQMYLKAAERCSDSYLPAYGLACLAAIEKNVSQAIAYLTQAQKMGFSSRSLVNEEPSFAPIRNEPDFISFVNKLP